ncbi:putative Signal transduction response regulator [Vibrio nigripulchritudo MADA3029]|uniref:response regulator n=1 Tax=Vibrio nigripulchritudo TaxID=28173 RepID=UPI0003B1D13A|nr:response regulator transcription factor [Vibrio nigripulchritudo]CCN48378.1 putative Signal transduction response regulator [Vibrio nigripulchritudo MADA3020]CCN52148.1 putative Signal transduction response regulator [Vibrio nigripulchritudo MADA3021]CCN58125.1 putative Signal transduction response regulator [Vibrio nigripulchritudo MADA3029]
MTSILLADDHTLFQDTLAECLGKESQFSIIGQAENGLEAVHLTQKMRPDILLTDISMDKMSGIEVLEALKEQNSRSKVVILSMHKDEEYVTSAIRSGACGYISKDISSSELVKALEVIASGGTFFSQSISGHIFQAFNQKQTGRVSLTPREKDVLIKIGEGRCNKSIANQLDISVRTVETHRLRIKKKLEIKTTAGLVKYCMDKGWLT